MKISSKSFKIISLRGEQDTEGILCCVFDFSGVRTNYWKTLFKTYHIGHSSGMLVTMSINENLYSKQHCHNSHYLFHSNSLLANLSKCYSWIQTGIFLVYSVSEFRIEFRLSKDISSHILYCCFFVFLYACACIECTTAGNNQVQLQLIDDTHIGI